MTRIYKVIFLSLSVVYFSISTAFTAMPIPSPKKYTENPGAIELKAFKLNAPEDFEKEANLLKANLQALGITESDDGIPVHLMMERPELPPINSEQQGELIQQSYYILVDEDGVSITAPAKEGMLYAIQTFDQLLDGKQLQHCEILDWPDISMRFIMVDPARQNENMDYYCRVIDFAARYKINGILCHLTDDQTSAIYHEDYPPLMHDHAWKPEEIRELVSYAANRGISLVPEIESLGHSRIFTRMENYEDYLHRTPEDQPDQSWMGTSISGYTNVLCPASDDAIEYLDALYTRTTETFDNPLIHIGFDEVDMTQCARCIAKYGEQTHEEWLSAALKQAHDLVSAKGKKTALWGDMLLAHPVVMDSISPEDMVIFDWHYGETVDPGSVKFFKDRGFQIIASPALVCAPHMIMPDIHNYRNIENFTRIAREEDLLGINTTIWVPTRYMSDVLWTGIGYAAAQAWGGGNFDEEQYFIGFARDYFGSDQGAEYHKAWKTITETVWHRREFYKACWDDKESVEEARTFLKENRADIQKKRIGIFNAIMLLKKIDPSIKEHQTEWNCINDSAEVLLYTFDHLLAVEDLRMEGVSKLDKECVEFIRIIEADWDRNRFKEDPGKDGRFLTNQHLLYQFKQMHLFHQELLKIDEN